MKSTRILISVVLGVCLLLAAFALAGCSNKDVAAKVNGQVITVTELNAQVDQLKKQYPQMFTGADAKGACWTSSSVFWTTWSTRC
jgi:outer membrane murein-binding lipoprotein Lpp